MEEFVTIMGLGLTRRGVACSAEWGVTGGGGEKAGGHAGRGVDGFAGRPSAVGPFEPNSLGPSMASSARHEFH